MSTIVTRAGKGSPLTNNEVDANFTNLNTDKLESADLSGYAELTGATFTGDVEGTEFIGSLRGNNIFKAQAGEALSKGDAIYISGISGNTPVVSLADANNAAKMPAFGVAADDATLNSAVDVVTYGAISSVDTSGFTLGDTLYVSTTPGQLVSTPPTGESSLIQNLGKVERVHASTGILFIAGAGRTNATPNLDDGNFFLGNGSNQSVSADFETSVTGIALPLTGGALTGAVTTNSTFDGRDVSVDGAKLDGIESGATADQTAAEIKTAYESNANTNAFTDADETKLDGIEAGADVTDTTNVTAAGALMDSEVTNLAQVKAFDSADYATAAQGATADAALPLAGGALTGAVTTTSTFDGRDVSVDGTKLDGIESGATADQTAAEIKTAYESNADTNAFTDADETKLDGIEASADVTDTANVTAAGALMDSEVTNLAQVKAFDSSDYATAAQGTTADSALQNVVDDTTPQLGGDLDLNSSDITGTGNIDITGTATMDGLTVDGVAKVLGTAGNTLIIADATETNGYQIKSNTSASSDFGFLIEDLAGKDLLKIESNNDISFYEDTGTTAKMVWDASAESLGIGTSSPDTLLEVVGADPILTIRDTETSGASSNATLRLAESGASDTLNNYWDINHTGGSALRFVSKIGDTTAERMRIDSSGNVLIKTASHTPTQTELLVSSEYDASGTTDAGITLSARASGTWRNSGIFANGSALTFTTGDTGLNGALVSSEKMRIDSSGNLLVGKTSASSATVGFQAGQDGFIAATRASGQPLVLNRTTNDGIIADFRKDGTTVGSIGVALSDNLYLSGVDAGIGFGTGTVYPATTTGQTSDNDTNLGTASTRFKDLHLSGAANVGSIALGDNGQATFGASDDLKIYHDGSNSYVTDTGTGNLFIGGSSYVDIGNGVTGMGGQTYARFNTSGSCQLNYNGVSRLTTTSAGVDVNGSITIAGGITEDAVTLSGTSTTINLATATNFVHDLTGNTTYTFSNAATTGNASAFTLKIIQGSTARTITWPASVDWAGGTAPTLTTTNDGVDVFVFYTIDGGTTYYGFTAGQAMA